MKLNGYKIVESILLEDDDPDRPGPIKGAMAGGTMGAAAGLGAGLAAPRIASGIEKAAQKVGGVGPTKMNATAQNIASKLRSTPGAGKLGALGLGAGAVIGGVTGLGAWGAHKAKKQAQAF